MSHPYSRREMLRRCAMGAAWFSIPRLPVNAAMPASHSHTPDPSSASSPKLDPFQDPLRIPPTLKPVIRGKTAYYSMTMRESLATFHRDLPPVRVWGYNGLFPGPIVRAKVGHPVIVRQINDLPPHTAPLTHGMAAPLPAVHLHGARVRPEHDGHPDNSIPSGGFRHYHYPNQQRAATLLFHDHAHGATGMHVYMGLAGLYLIEDPAEAVLGLPSGAQDIPLVIQDRIVQPDGSLHYMINEQTRQNGMFGDVILVNGVIQPFHVVATRLYRLRLLNGSNARIYELKLSSGQPLIQIASDGGLLRSPIVRGSVALAPFERAEVIVDFSKVQAGTSVVVQNALGEGRTAEIMRFDVVQSESVQESIPECLSDWEELPAREALRTRQFNLDRQSTASGATWTINGKSYEPSNPPLAQPRIGDLETWRFVNPTNHPHPMHLHLVQFQVVEINGEAQDPASHGWKDTVVVPPNGDATIVVRFDGYTGRYLFHCHNLEHEDLGMMGEFEVLPLA